MIPTRIVSTVPAWRWEDAMVSGNGSTGIMVMGRPLDEMVIVNHEKLWVVMANTVPQVPNLAAAWAEARTMAFEGRYRDAMEHFNTQRREAMRPLLEAEGIAGRHRLPYDHIHPGLHLHIETDAHGAIEHYRRETVLDTGEIRVRWQDAAGRWLRRTFVSRTDDVIVMEYLPPDGERLSCRLRLREAPGRGPDEMGAVTIVHAEGELYFHAAYARSMGKPEAEGYHLLARISARGGTLQAAADERLDVRDTGGLLVVMRLEYLDRAAAANADGLRASLAALARDYETLLAPHAEEHGEMFRRVTLDLETAADTAPSSEALLADAEANGPSAALLEMLHAVGRYALICAGTGDLPVALSGIWGNTWQPPWDGRYTFDANINLAISGVSQGALPEAMDTFCRYLEGSLADWSVNARQVCGCRGVLADLCQGWRHGAALMLYPWVGGVGWLASYLYDHYLYTGDREFLARRVVPLLREVALFYEDFLAGTEDAAGRVRLYPSVSPENVPTMKDRDQASSVVPNATCDVAICREALTNLVTACRTLGIEAENVPRWETLLARLPDYAVNEDGALSEWICPGAGDRYNHRHSSHLYPLSPSLECTPEGTPALFRAVRRAVDKRLEAGLGNKSGHGFMHVALVAARLRDPELLWRMFSDFARLRFLNTSMISCHNPGPVIYNLDSTFTMPAVLLKMLVHSEPGRLVLLPALPTERLSSGTARGIRARGGLTVELLRWNFRTRHITLQLRAAAAGILALDSPIPLRAVRAEEPVPGLEISGEDRGAWQLTLPAEQSVRLRCSV